MFINYSKFIFTNSILKSNLLIKILLKTYLDQELDLQLLTNGDLKMNLISEFGLTSNIISQFGYQFEKQIMGDENVARISRRNYFYRWSRTWIIFT